MVAHGNVVDITGYLEAPGVLYIQPGTYIEVPETPPAVRKGVFTIKVDSLDVSPFVNPGSVSHVIFDHTSIIKTILVRHRDVARKPATMDTLPPEMLADPDEVPSASRWRGP